MNGILCADMDNTIIYSYKRNIGENKLNVELYNGREISFISEKTHDLLKKVSEKMTIIPTSTRTEEQYKRIDLDIGIVPYALVCNGGVLLVNGKRDREWYLESLQMIQNSRPEMEKAQQIQKIMRCFALDAKIVSRKKSFVVYLKEGAQIVDVLNVMEAHQSLMELENIRILKDMRNTVNRKVNCETANINKTVSAAVKQIDDIRYIEETKGLDKLPEGLKDMALTRLTYPEASLKELGALLQNPVGKSGVNHRLRKLSEMAEEIRAKQGGTL